MGKKIRKFRMKIDMINLFRKKKMIQEDDYIFLKAIVKNLPIKYSYLINQVSNDFILDKKINRLGDNGTFTLTLNTTLENKYSDKTLPQLFIIKDIGVWNKVKGAYELVELHILEGMLAGFRLAAKYHELDMEKINVLKVKEKHFINEQKDYLKRLFGNVEDEILSQLNIESTFLIELPEGEFFVLKDLKDGNYLSMDKNGSVFGMIHDPYIIEKLFDDKESFFRALKDGTFNIEAYFEKKIS